MTQTTTSPPSSHGFPLLQELVDLIIDQVAYASGGYGADQPNLTGLITCSLISRRFYPRARAHLHRNIHLNVHIDNIDDRAHALLRSLQKQADCQCLESIPLMDSLSLVVHNNPTGVINNPVPINRLRLRGESGSGGFSELIRHAQTHFSSTLRHFSLVLRCVGQQDAADLRTPNAPVLNQALLGFFTNSKLKTLRLVNVSNVSLKMLIDVFFLPHLVELTLNNLTFAPGTAEGSGVLSSTRKFSPSLKKLEIRHIPHDKLLLSLLPLLSASEESSPKLQRLTMSLNFDDNSPNLAALSQIGIFMECNSVTLKTLEIESYEYPDVGKYFRSSTRSRIPLSKLLALESLRFTIRNGSSLDFLQRMLGDLVMGCRYLPSFRGSLRSLELKVVLPFPIHPTQVDEPTSLIGIAEACRMKIDPILASPHTVAFSSLENVKILVFLFHCTSKTHVNDQTDTEGRLRDFDRSWKDAFPMSMATSRINLTVGVRHVFSEDTMERYLIYSCCAEDPQ